TGGRSGRGAPRGPGTPRGRGAPGKGAARDADLQDAPDRLVSAEARDEDGEGSIRPLALEEFIGQAQARANLDVFIRAARARNDALDHVLFVGPPGLGKTTLAQI